MTQYFYPEVLIEMLSTSLSLLLLNIIVERSQMIVDPKTGLKNKKNFKRVINSIFKRKDNHGLVVFYIRNYLVLYDKYDYDDALNHLRYLSSLLSKLLSLDFKYETYYLENGLFGLITSNIEEAKRLANRLNSAIVKEYDAKIVFNLRYTLCTVDVLNDFNYANDFHQFMFNFSDSITYDKTVISIDDIKKDVKHNIIIKLDDILSDVIDNHNVLIEFQPIYDLRAKKYTVIEALARIEDKELGVIYADNFVPYAEKKDMMYRIDMIILEEIFDLYKKNRTYFYDIKYLAINISVQTISNPDFLNDLQELERKNNINKNIIVFEVKERENVAFDRYDYEAIRRLVINGYALSLDNYGVGCIPVSSLAKIPFVNVKIDSELTKNCGDKDTYILLDNTVKLFTNLNKKSVFAGVEDEKTASIIETMNPDYVQGYYYSKPLDINELIKFLKEKNQKV